MNHPGHPLGGRARVARFEGLGRTTVHGTRQDRRVFRRRGRFVNGTSRRVRAPLTVYQGHLRVLVRSSSLSRTRLRRLVGARRALRRVAGLGGSLLLLSGVSGKRFSSAQAIRFGDVLGQCVRSCGRMCNCQRVRLALSRRKVFQTRVGRSLTMTLVAGLLGGTFMRGMSNKRVQVRVANRDVAFEGDNTNHPLSTARVFRQFCRKDGGRNSAKLKLTVTSSVYGLRRLALECCFRGSRRYFRLQGGGFAASCTSWLARGKFGPLEANSVRLHGRIWSIISAAPQRAYLCGSFSCLLQRKLPTRHWVLYGCAMWIRPSRRRWSGFCLRGDVGVREVPGSFRGQPSSLRCGLVTGGGGRWGGSSCRGIASFVHVPIRSTGRHGDKQ